MDQAWNRQYRQAVVMASQYETIRTRSPEECRPKRGGIVQELWGESGDQPDGMAIETVMRSLLVSLATWRLPLESISMYIGGKDWLCTCKTCCTSSGIA